MKRWSGQLFPIVLLSLLAALSFWLERAVDLPEGKHDGKQRHDPDAFVENFTVRRLNVDGVLQYRLSAPRMQHYPDDDSSLLDQPKITYYRPDTPDMTLTGKHAYAISKGEVVLFWDDVVATRAATAQRPEMVARMPDLTIQPDDGIGFTGSPVQITEGQSWVKGVGMHLDNNESTLVLQSQVTGLYFKPKAPQ
jgi:lipopolysaccharide export system protein LptC